MDDANVRGENLECEEAQAMIAKLLPSERSEVGAIGGAEMNDRIVCLHVLNWSVSLGGEHFTGRIHGYRRDKYTSEDVKQKASAKMALALNKKSGARGYGARIKPGDEIDQFATKQELEKEAAKQYRKLFPAARILLVGSLDVCNPQRCLSGPRLIKSKINSLFRKRRECGGYERNPKEMERLTRLYQKLLEALK